MLPRHPGNVLWTHPPAKRFQGRVRLTGQTDGSDWGGLRLVGGLGQQRQEDGEPGYARAAGDDGKSTGLGLAIVDAVVAAHGGCIMVTSRPGMTRFAIILPLLRQLAPQASPV